MERFWSSLKQQAVVESMESIPSQTLAHLLHRIQDGNCDFDHHFESQAMSLSSPHMFSPQSKEHEILSKDNVGVAPDRQESKQNFMVPVDFIGRMEHLQEDFLQLMHIIQQRTGRLPQATVDEIAKDLVQPRNSGGKLKDTVLELRTPAIDAIVRKIYAQDINCFAGTHTVKHSYTYT